MPNPKVTGDQEAYRAPNEGEFLKRMIAAGVHNEIRGTIALANQRQVPLGSKKVNMAPVRDTGSKQKWRWARSASGKWYRQYFRRR